MRTLAQLLLLLLVVGPRTLPGQALPESSRELITWPEFWQRVAAFHPLAQRATLLPALAEQELRAARGQFDPKLYADLEEKRFDGKQYYRYGSGGIKVPTAFALTAKAEYNISEGTYINPERRLPAQGQAVLGLSMPLLQGLWLDERRYTLRAARQQIDINTAAAEAQRLDLYLEAAKTYWSWAGAYYAREITAEALQLSRENLAYVRAGYEVGDEPAIDTLEAFLQVQSREVDLAAAQLELANIETEVVALLWTTDGLPISTLVAAQPQPPVAEPIDLNWPSLRAEALPQHPQLRQTRAKLQQLELERRWKREQLKPSLTAEYNLLGRGTDLTPDAGQESIRDLLMRNYKYGLTFEFPLLLRKARAGVALTEIKIADTNWQLSQKQRELEAKFDIYAEQVRNLQEQISRFATAISGYDQLLAAEREKFAIGESSVFLLNSRIQKLLDARLKLLKLQTEAKKAMAALRAAAGRLNG